MLYAVLTPWILLPMVWPFPRSLATTSRISVDFFSSPYLDVSVRAVPPAYLCVQYAVTGLPPAGFPHSGTHGSLPAFGSPWLFADCRALLRLPVPRHPPCALSSLTCIQALNYARIPFLKVPSCKIIVLPFNFFFLVILYSVLKVHNLAPGN